MLLSEIQALRRRKRKINYARKLRKRETQHEALLWEELRSRRFNGWKFRRQVPVGPFIADFFSHPNRLIIEVDGGFHRTQDGRDRDRNRNGYFEENEYRVMHFTNDEVEKDLPSVLRKIDQTIKQNTDKPLSPPPKGRQQNENFGAERDK